MSRGDANVVGIACGMTRARNGGDSKEITPRQQLVRRPCLALAPYLSHLWSTPAVLAIPNP